MSENPQELLEQARQAASEGRAGDAKTGMERAIAELRGGADCWALAQGLRTAAEVCRRLGDRASALSLYEEAVPLYREHGDRLRLAHAVRHLGDVYMELQRREPAEACYAEALALYRNAPSPPEGDLANALRSLAALKQDTGDLEEARALWQEARDRYEAAGITEGVAASSAHLALIAWKQGDADAAGQWLERARAASEAAGSAGVAQYISELQSLIGARKP